ncbi:CidA/LrgA family protein [Aureimonas flava]|uniref:CidA/LrgA family protein n=1 Tax=Aureimonas flava TaxID=2320271 RepID=A0A3A1WM84_9HYPH|nr:CidA/LrgA family protein [Aureimonas flava]RIY02667.1 CidA/LrgA family protein [Aureimonas flava]
MLFGLFVLLACQLAGETLVRLLGLPVPGPVLGILLLLAVLALAERRRPASASEPGAPVGRAADGLLAHLGLLFVPAGVGVARSPELLLANGPGVLAALVLSTVLTLLVTVGVFRLARRRSGGGAA